MNQAPKWPIFLVLTLASTLVLPLAGCAGASFGLGAGGGSGLGFGAGVGVGASVDPQDGRTHLSPAQCRDLTAIKSNAPPTAERNRSELAALEQAGYHPSMFYDPYYPDDLQAAQRIVDFWYQSECVPAQSG